MRKIVLLLTLSLLLLAPPVQAEQIPQETQLQLNALRDFNSSDTGHAILDFVMGGGQDSYLSPSLLSTISVAINTIALAMMGVLAAFGLLSYVIHTANKGSPGGQIISSFWMPIRIATATILLIPLTGGYSTLQLGVYKIADAGNNAGNFLMQHGLDYVYTNGLYQPPVIADMQPVIAGWIGSEVCAQYINSSTHDPQRIVPKMRLEQDANSVRATYSYDANAYRMTYDRNDPKLGYCGAVSITIPREAWFSDKMSYDYATPAKIQEKYAAFIATLQPKVAAVAEKILADQLSLVELQDEGEAKQDAFEQASINQPAMQSAAAAEFTALAQEANAALVTTIASSVNEQAAENSGASWKDEINASGWPALGTLFWQAALSQQRINHLAEIFRANYEPPHVDDEWDKEERFREISTRLRGMMKLALAIPKPNKLDGGILVSISHAGTDGSLDPIKSYVASIAHTTVESLAMGGADADLLTSLQYTGSVMAASGEVVYGAAIIATSSAKALARFTTFVASGMANAANSIPIAGSLFGAGATAAGAAPVAAVTFSSEAIAQISDMAKTIATVIIIAGFTLAVVLPSIPMIFWLMGVVSWMLFFIECLLVSPFWMAAHGTAEKEGWGTEHTRQGYMLMIGLYLNPVLRVAGFFACFIALRPLGLLVQWFSQYLQGVLVTGGMSAFMVVGSCVMLAIVSYSLMVRVFSLPNELFERGLRWVNGGQEVTGDEKAEHSTRIAVANFGGKGEQLSAAIGKAGTQKLPSAAAPSGKPSGTISS